MFFDGEKSVDRRRICTYTVVLRSALKLNIAADDIAGFIERNGGVQQIRLAKSATAKTPKQRAALGRVSIEKAAALATFRSDAISQRFDSEDHGLLRVALVIAKPDGTVDVRGVVKSAGAVNAALAAYYSDVAANDPSQAEKLPKAA